MRDADRYAQEPGLWSSLLRPDAPPEGGWSTDVGLEVTQAHHRFLVELPLAQPDPPGRRGIAVDARVQYGALRAQVLATRRDIALLPPLRPAAAWAGRWSPRCGSRARCRPDSDQTSLEKIVPDRAEADFSASGKGGFTEGRRRSECRTWTSHREGSALAGVARDLRREEAFEDAERRLTPFHERLLAEELTARRGQPEPAGGRAVRGEGGPQSAPGRGGVLRAGLAVARRLHARGRGGPREDHRGGHRHRPADGRGEERASSSSRRPRCARSGTASCARSSTSTSVMVDGRTRARHRQLLRPALPRHLLAPVRRQQGASCWRRFPGTSSSSTRPTACGTRTEPATRRARRCGRAQGPPQAAAHRHAAPERPDGAVRAGVAAGRADPRPRARLPQPLPGGRRGGRAEGGRRRRAEGAAGPGGAAHAAPAGARVRPLHQPPQHRGGLRALARGAGPLREGQRVPAALGGRGHRAGQEDAAHALLPQAAGVLDVRHRAHAAEARRTTSRSACEAAKLGQRRTGCSSSPRRPSSTSRRARSGPTTRPSPRQHRTLRARGVGAASSTRTWPTPSRSTPRARRSSARWTAPSR